MNEIGNSTKKWKDGLVQNWENMSRLYIVTLHINFHAEYCGVGEDS